MQIIQYDFTKRIKKSSIINNENIDRNRIDLMFLIK